MCVLILYPSLFGLLLKFQNFFQTFQIFQKYSLSKVHKNVYKSRAEKLKFITQLPVLNIVNTYEKAGGITIPRGRSLLGCKKSESYRISSVAEGDYSTPMNFYNWFPDIQSYKTRFVKCKKSFNLQNSYSYEKLSSNLTKANIKLTNNISAHSSYFSGVRWGEWVQIIRTEFDGTISSH